MRENAREISIREIAAAENAFADYAAAHGAREAFLKFSADDGIVSKPQPAKAKQV